MKPDIKPMYVIDSNGKKVAVQLTLRDYAELMEYIDKLENAKEKQKEPVKADPKPVVIKSARDLHFDNKPVLFEMHDEFCSAQGILLPDGKCFKVLAGSKASGIVDKKIPAHIKHIREDLMMLQVLVVDTIHGDLVFTRDYEFDNSSDAAGTIAASARDGDLCWRSLESGRTMKSIK